MNKDKWVAEMLQYFPLDTTNNTKKKLEMIWDNLRVIAIHQSLVQAAASVVGIYSLSNLALLFGVSDRSPLLLFVTVLGVMMSIKLTETFLPDLIIDLDKHLLNFKKFILKDNNLTPADKLTKFVELTQMQLYADGWRKFMNLVVSYIGPKYFATYAQGSMGNVNEIYNFLTLPAAGATVANSLFSKITFGLRNYLLESDMQNDPRYNNNR